VCISQFILEDGGIDIEERLITEIESVQEKHEEKINKEKHDICLLTSILKDNKQELEFVKKHGSNSVSV
jgi:hypothetical protein